MGTGDVWYLLDGFESLPRPIGDTDLRLALAQATPRMRAWLCLAAYTGLRCKEIAGVRAEDLHWNREPAVLVVSAPKGRRQRVVPIHREVESALRCYGVRRKGYVFPSWGDATTSVKPQTVSREVNRYLRELGIEATAHQLRHWFASSLYGLTKDIRLTQEMMGHRNPSTTAAYTKLSPADAAAAVQRL